MNDVRNTAPDAMLTLADRLASMPAAEAIRGPQDWATIQAALRALQPGIVSREELAIHFLACDAGSDVDWARPRFLEWKGQAHYGDCTKAPITCNRCLTEDAFKRADAILSLSANGRALEAAAQLLEKRASGYLARGTSIFNGNLVAEDLIHQASQVRALDLAQFGRSLHARPEPK